MALGRLRESGLGFFLALGLAAQGPGRVPTRVLASEDGLVNPLVNCLAQTPDGFIWAGTWSGLFRTDGRRFEFLPGAPQGSVQDLAVDGAGGLWVATEGGLAIRQGGAFRILGPADGLPAAGTYRRVLCMPDGGVWVLREGRIHQSKGTRFEPWELSGHGLIQDLTWAPKNGGVLAVGARALIPLAGGSPIPLPNLEPSDQLLEAAEDALGHLWLRSRKGLWRREPGGTAWVDQEPRFKGATLERLEARPGGEVFVHTTAGAILVRGDEQAFFPKENHVGKGGGATALIDREGATWIGSYGVSRALGSGLWRVYGTQQGLASDDAWGLLQDRDGRIWVGTGKGLCLATPDGWRTVFKGPHLLSVTQAPDGQLWATGAPQDTIHRIDPVTFRVTSFKVPTQEPTQFREVIPSADGRHLWVFPRFNVPGLAYHGVAEAGGWAWKPIRSADGPLTSVSYMGKAPDGRVYLTAPAGLFEVTEGEARLVLPKAAGWSPQYLAFAPDGTIYLAHNQSGVILRYRPSGSGFDADGELRIPSAPGAPSLIWGMALDVRGALWVSTSQGVFRVQPSVGRVMHWTTQEGVPSNDCNALALLPMRNGDVWVGTAGGLALFKGSLERPMEALPTPLITSVQVHGESLPVGREALVVKPFLGSLEFRFAALHYGFQSRINYEVRVVGLDQEWTALVDPSFSLRGIDPGTYRLEVRAVIPGELWSPPASLEFRIEPRWWQTAWAKIGLALLGLLGVAAAIRFQARRLRHQNELLERLVAERTTEIARITTDLLLAKEQAEGASRSKSAFIANMSHELRTPLNAVLLYGELLQESARETGNTQDLEDLRKIESSGKHLLSLINGLLDLAKIEAGRMTLYLEDADLRGLMNEIIATLAPLAESKGNSLTLRPFEGFDIRTDITKFRQVFFNLISNANKFTEGGAITLNVQRRGHEVEISVIDTGIGISPEQMERLFQPFVQADASTTRKFGGTGLGLNISKRLCELLGGRIELSSKEGEGTTFRVTLPVSTRLDSPKDAQTMSGEFASAGDRPLALLVDEDPVSRDFVSRVLAKEGYWVATAKRMDEGVQLAQRLHPRVLVLDAALAFTAEGAVLERLVKEAGQQATQVFWISLGLEHEKGLVLQAPELLSLPASIQSLADVLANRAPSVAPGRALLIDTEEGQRSALATMVVRNGWEAEVSRGVEDAFRRLRTRPFDIIFMDLMMSDQNGLIFLLRLQEDPLLRDVPVVALIDKDQEDQLFASTLKEARRNGLQRTELSRVLAAMVRAR